MNKLNKQQAQILYDIVQTDLEQHPYLRRGQSLFNKLVELHPQWDEPARGSRNDPFYRDELIPAFLEEILDEEALAQWYSNKPL